MTAKELGLDEDTTHIATGVDISQGQTTIYHYHIPSNTIKTYSYDVAISYAGEDLVHAKALAATLKAHEVHVFFDLYEKPTLWGQDLYAYLSDIYQNQAQYCVMFLSQHYATKLWPTHEREATQARAFKEQEVYILPIRLDDTEVLGILRTTAYLHWHRETVESITTAIMEKLKQENT